MKRYDKDGKEFTKVEPMGYDSYLLGSKRIFSKDNDDPDSLNLTWLKQCEDYQKEFNNTLTPQQMAEKIKELKKELLTISIVRNTVKDKLKDSQQEVERLKEGVKAVLNKWNLGDADKVLRQLLETKQKQEG